MTDQNSPHPVTRRGWKVDLCPMDEGDLPFLTSTINDQDINQYLTVVFPMNRADEAKWLEGLGSRRPDDIIFAIRHHGSPEIIGSIGLHGIKAFDQFATMGYYIGRKELWGKGLGTEATMLLLEYAFNTLNLQKVAAEVYDFNPRSQKCLEKCGFKVEGVLKRHRFRLGRFVDSLQLAAFREDFMPLWERFKLERGKSS